MNGSAGISGAASGAAMGSMLGPWGAVGGGALGGLAGLFSGGDDSQEYMDKAVQELIKVKIPDPEKQKLALERYRSAGELTPELESAIKQDPSAFEKIVKDQHYASAQNRALGQLQSLGEEGGMSLSDKANLQEQLIASGNKDKANREAITDDMARRGQLGSGMSLQAQLGGAQAAGDRNAMSGLRTLADSRDRSLKAIMGAGDLAGSLSEQDYRQKSDAASASDRINAFNTQNAQSVQQRNVGARNTAQATNLQNKQNLMNSNVDLGNREQQYNKELEQKRFDNEMQKSGAVANAYTGQATGARQDAAQNRQMWGSVAGAAGQAAGAVKNQQNWDEFLKRYK